MSVLGTVLEASNQPPFHGLQGSAEPTLRSARPCLHPVLTITVLPRLRQVRQGGGPARPTPKRRGWRILPPRHWNINQFPLRQLQAMCCLRDRLTLGRRSLPRNPGPYGGGDSHPSLLLLPPGSAPPVGPLDLSAQLLPNRSAPLPMHPKQDAPPGLCSWLSPENLRGPGSRLVSCYALFKG